MPGAYWYLAASIADCLSCPLALAATAVAACAGGMIAGSETGPGTFILCVVAAIGAELAIAPFVEEAIDLLMMAAQLHLADATLLDGLCTCMGLAGVEWDCCG